MQSHVYMFSVGTSDPKRSVKTSKTIQNLQELQPRKLTQSEVHLRCRQLAIITDERNINEIVFERLSLKIWNEKKFCESGAKTADR